MASDRQEFLVPFNGLVEARADVKGRLRAGFDRVLESGTFMFGEETTAFAAEFGEFIGSEHLVFVGNGTDALEISLKAVGVGHGDVVLTVANAGGYGAVATRAVGATPEYLDVTAEDLLVDVAALKMRLEGGGVRPMAVIVTHLYGGLAPIREIVDLCRRHSIRVIEDCAQGAGLRDRGRHVGTFGDIGTYSFYPTKNLGAVGDAGAITTNNSEIFARLKALSQYGWTAKYHSELAFGRNSRMDEIQAAMLRVKLPMVADLNQRRREIYDLYLGSFPDLRFVHRNHRASNIHLAVLQFSQRDQVQELFRGFGIETVVHYPVPDYKQPGLRDQDHFVELPVTEASAASVLSIPCHPNMTDGQVERVCDALEAIQVD